MRAAGHLWSKRMRRRIHAAFAPQRRRLLVAAIVLAASAPALLAQTAGAAVSAPAVTTGHAREVSYGSATLTGSLNPNGSDTSYYFQYGLTKAYGGQTAIADAGAGTSTVKVSLPVTGLEPLSVYHYRLVAVNGRGATIGGDETLLTTKVPLTLAILSSPNPALYGGTVTVQGTLSGTDNADREVVLQANAFPFSAGFQNVGNPRGHAEHRLFLIRRPRPRAGDAVQGAHHNQPPGRQPGGTGERRGAGQKPRHADQAAPLRPHLRDRDAG